MNNWDENFQKLKNSASFITLNLPSVTLEEGEQIAAAETKKQNEWRIRSEQIFRELIDPVLLGLRNFLWLVMKVFFITTLGVLILATFFFNWYLILCAGAKKLYLVWWTVDYEISPEVINTYITYSLVQGVILVKVFKDTVFSGEGIIEQFFNGTHKLLSIFRKKSP